MTGLSNRSSLKREARSLFWKNPLADLYRMSLISAGSISLDSTFNIFIVKKLKKCFNIMRTILFKSFPKVRVIDVESSFLPMFKVA
jgi:hypothetical protein